MIYFQISYISSIFVFSTDIKSMLLQFQNVILMWLKFTTMICEDEIVELKFKNKN